VVSLGTHTRVCIRAHTHTFALIFFHYAYAHTCTYPPFPTHTYPHLLSPHARKHSRFFLSRCTHSLICAQETSLLLSSRPPTSNHRWTSHHFHTHSTELSYNRTAFPVGYGIVRPRLLSAEWITVTLVSIFYFVAGTARGGTRFLCCYFSFTLLTLSFFFSIFFSLFFSSFSSFYFSSLHFSSSASSSTSISPLILILFPLLFYPPSSFFVSPPLPSSLLLPCSSPSIFSSSFLFSYFLPPLSPPPSSPPTSLLYSLHATSSLVSPSSISHSSPSRSDCYRKQCSQSRWHCEQVFMHGAAPQHTQSSHAVQYIPPHEIVTRILHHDLLRSTPPPFTPPIPLLAIYAHPRRYDVRTFSTC
jgi:hypothetical protein